uniref:Uncharacterized protein n=1 Tax=Megaviridae environmental sample TaxID=1737588 RepID=A0A5J6VI91_9VIRU|nr:MAG: hypothetical protein [Megaviridae environmental sample]
MSVSKLDQMMQFLIDDLHKSLHKKDAFDTLMNEYYKYLLDEFDNNMQIIEPLYTIFRKYIYIYYVVAKRTNESILNYTSSKKMDAWEKTACVNILTFIDYLGDNSIKIDSVVERFVNNEIIKSLYKKKDYHNIYKIIIFDIFNRIDRWTFNILMDKIERTNAAYITIKVTRGSQNVFTIHDIQLLDPTMTFWQVEEYMQISKHVIIPRTYLDMLDWLFEKHIVVPITDEFFRFHSQGEFRQNEDNTDKDKIKIKQILRRINDAKNRNATYYRQGCQSIVYDELDEVKIEGKILGENKVIKNLKKDDIINLYKDLMEIRQDGYINFNDTPNDIGLLYTPTAKLTSIRYCSLGRKIIKRNLRYNHKGIYDLDSQPNIIGLAVNMRDIPQQTYSINTFINNLEKIEPCALIWTKNMDLKTNITTIYNRQQKLLAKYLYKQLKTQSQPFKLLQMYEKELERYIYLKLHYWLLTYINKKYVITPHKIKHDKYMKLVKIMPVKETHKRMILGENIDNSIHTFTHVNATCAHNIAWNRLVNRRERETYIHTFVKQYAITDEKNTFICKSCGEHLKLQKYISDGFTDGDQFIITDLQNTESIELKYSRMSSVFKNIEKDIHIFGRALDFTDVIGTSQQAAINRKTYTSTIIDAIQHHNFYIKDNIFKNITNQRKYIKYDTPIITKLYGFSLDNNVFVASGKEKQGTSSDIDKFKQLKRDTIFIYIIVIIVMHLGESDIRVFPQKNKRFNFVIFNKIISSFDNIQILINMSGDLKPASDYPGLCYSIYYLINIMIDKRAKKNKMKFSNVEKNNQFKQAIIDVFILINSFIAAGIDLRNNNKQTTIYSSICSKLILKLASVYIKPVNVITIASRFRQTKLSTETNVHPIYINKSLNSKLPFWKKPLLSSSRLTYRYALANKKPISFSKKYLELITREFHLDKFKNETRIDLPLQEPYQHVSKQRMDFDALEPKLEKLFQKEYGITTESLQQSFEVIFKGKSLHMNKQDFKFMKSHKFFNNKSVYFYKFESTQYYFDAKLQHHIGSSIGTNFTNNSDTRFFNIIFSTYDALRLLGFTKMEYNISEHIAEQIHADYPMYSIFDIQMHFIKENENIKKINIKPYIIQCIKNILNTRSINLKTCIGQLKQWMIQLENKTIIDKNPLLLYYSEQFSNTNIYFNSSIQDYNEYYEQIDYSTLVKKIRIDNGIYLHVNDISEFTQTKNTGDYVNLCSFIKGLYELATIKENKSLPKFGLFLLKSIRVLFDRYMQQNNVENNFSEQSINDIVDCAYTQDTIRTAPTFTSEEIKQHEQDTEMQNDNDNVNIEEGINDIDADFDTDDQID